MHKKGFINSPCRRFINGVVLALWFGWALGPACGGDINVNLGPYINSDIRSWTTGSNYPFGGFTTNYAGITFYLAGYPGRNNGLGVIYTGDGSVTKPVTNNFAVNVPNAVTVYTIINSSWGNLGATNGTVECYGSQGAHVSFYLVQGINIRDHRISSYNGVVSSNIMSLYWGADNIDRLDCQGWMLPVEFYSQTLTNIQVKSFGNSSTGVPTVAAITVRTAGPNVSIKRSGNQAVCYWPSTPTNHVLQTTLSLQDPDWQSVAKRPVVTNNQFALTNTATGSAQFFRLVAMP